jgi:hypothetical protein
MSECCAAMITAIAKIAADHPVLVDAIAAGAVSHPMLTEALAKAVREGWHFSYISPKLAAYFIGNIIVFYR